MDTLKGKMMSSQRMKQGTEPYFQIIFAHVWQMFEIFAQKGGGLQDYGDLFLGDVVGTSVAYNPQWDVTSFESLVSFAHLPHISYISIYLTHFTACPKLSCTQFYTN